MGISFAGGIGCLKQRIFKDASKWLYYITGCLEAFLIFTIAIFGAIIRIIWDMVMVLYDFAGFNNIAIVVIMFMHNIILIDDIMPMLNDMLMLIDLAVRPARIRFSVGPSAFITRASIILIRAHAYFSFLMAFDGQSICHNFQISIKFAIH